MINVCEVWLRDGIQGWPSFIETEDKKRVLQAIIAAGIAEIDATSFVSPKLVPQLIDGREVLAAIDSRVRTRALVANMKGAEAAIDAHREVRRINRCGIPFSVSEAHNLANLRRNHAEHREAVSSMIESLLKAGIPPLLGVVTAFGCPIQGRIDPEQSLALAAWAYGLGVRAIMFGDTTGLANPNSVGKVFAAARSAFPDAELIAHFHDNRGAGIANTLAAINAGARTVDACLGGMGGEPVDVEQGIVGDQGNVVTEDLVNMLAAAGFDTGIDLEALLEAGAIAEKVIGRRLHSKVQRAGLGRIG
jgi:hydroxymethylglutaryl-CoA lyase